MRRRSPLPGTVVALGFVSLFTDVGAEMIFPLLPLFLTGTLHASASILGVIEGAADSVASLMQIPAGRTSDARRRRKPIVALGYGISGLARPLMAVATAPWHALAVRVSDRVGKGIRGAPRDALIADVTPRERVGRAYGFHRAMDHAGAVIGPLIASALLARGLPLRHVFLWAAIPGVVSWLIVLGIRERATRENAAPAPARPADAHAPLPATLRRYLWILLVFSIAGSTDAFLILRARDLGIAAAMIPLLWSVLHISKMVCTQSGGFLADRFPRPALLTIGWIVYAAVYAGFALAREAVVVWPLMAIYGIYHGLTEPSEKAMVRDLAPSAARGRAFGWYNLVIGASALPASALAGWVWQHVGARAALTMDAAIALVACALIAAWSRSSSTRSLHQPVG